MVPAYTLDGHHGLEAIFDLLLELYLPGPLRAGSRQLHLEHITKIIAKWIMVASSCLLGFGLFIGLIGAFWLTGD